MNSQILETDFDEYLPFHNDRGRDDRFQYAKVRRGDQWYFLKIATSESTKRNLQREEAWSVFMADVAKQFPGEKLRGPVFKELIAGGQAALFEFIDAPHARLEDWHIHVDRYARMLHVLDAAAEGWTSELLPQNLHRAEDYERVWRKWFGENITRVSDFNKAVEFVKTRYEFVSTRMQHGDLTPLQMFDDAGEWIIYDGELSGTDLPRYNDLAYGYGRLYTKYHQPEVARALLKSFIAQLEIPVHEFEKAFAPVMMGRAVGMLADAYRDEETNLYIEQAQDLFERALTGKLEDL